MFFFCLEQDTFSYFTCSGTPRLITGTKYVGDSYPVLWFALCNFRWKPCEWPALNVIGYMPLRCLAHSRYMMHPLATIHEQLSNPHENPAGVQSCQHDQLILSMSPTQQHVTCRPQLSHSRKFVLCRFMCVCVCVCVCVYVCVYVCLCVCKMEHAKTGNSLSALLGY